MAFNKEVEKEGTGNNPIELEYKLTCDKDYTVEATLSPATASSWVSIVGDGNKEGVFEIRISKNDGSSRNVSVYPRIYNNEHILVSDCTSKGVFISQKGDGGSSECSFEITITYPKTWNCNAGTLSFDYVKKGESPSPEPTGCKIPLTATTTNGQTYDSTMRLDAEGDRLTFTHGSPPSPGPTPTDAESWLKAAYCVDYSSPYDHQSKGDGEFTVIVVNNSSNDFLWSGKIKVPISKNGQTTSTNFYYREPSYVACHYINQNGGYWAYGAHMAYATNTNMVFKRGTTTTWRVPIHRSTPATRLTDSRCSSALEEDLRGATILTTPNSELSCAGGTVGKEASYGTITFVSNLICTITKQGGTSSSLSIETGATYTFTVTGSTNYNFDAGNTEIVGSGNKAYLNHNSSGSQVIVPLNAGEWYEGN